MAIPAGVLLGLSMFGNTLGQQISQSNAMSLMSANSALGYRNQERWYNKYSSPSALVNQYHNAGLNAGMMMSGSDGIGTTNSALPSMADNHGDYGLGDSLMQAYNTYLNAKMQEAQIKNINADTENKESQKGVIEQTIEKLSKEVDWQKLQNEFFSDTFDDKVQLLKNQVLKEENLAALTDAEKRQIEEVLPFLASLKKAELSKIGAEISKIKSEVSINKAELSVHELRGRLAKEGINPDSKGLDKFLDILINSPDTIAPIFRSIIDGLVDGVVKGFGDLIKKGKDSILDIFSFADKIGATKSLVQDSNRWYNVT